MKIGKKMNFNESGFNECPGYDTKQSDDEVSVMLELWGMRSTPFLPSLPDPYCPGVVYLIDSNRTV